MQISLPWILSRKRLVIAVMADGFLFSTLYYALYVWRFGVWPGLSPRLAALLVIWTLSSYVVGRYVSGGERDRQGCKWEIVGRQLFATGTVLSLNLGVTLLHIWLFSQNPVQASFRSFLIPFLGSLAVLSPFIQLTIRRFSVIKELDQSSIWTYVGSDLGFQQLQKMSMWTRLSVSIEHVRIEHLSKTFSTRYIVDKFYGQPANILSVLSNYQSQGSIILTRLSWCEAMLQRLPPELLSDEDLLAGCFSIPNGTFQNRLKRLGDIVVATLLLIVTSPLIFIAALCIKCSDRGPVFYSQVRTGLDGNPFRIWKLRTMRTDAELQGAQWSSRSDPRITKVGSILRMTRLDELPQLWCVLTGSMSLIGPRPERPEFDQELSRRIPYYGLRHQIRPGLSGWAQVNYPYGASFEDSSNKLSYDLYYMKNFSFFFDLLILFKTMRLVFNAKGALPEPSTASNPFF